MTKNKRIVIAAGGTGGHVIPAIILAEALQKQGQTSQLLHDSRVKHIVKSHDKLPARQLFFAHGTGKLMQAFKLFSVMINMILLCFTFLLNRPKYAVSFGGYVAAPALMAAKVLRVPIVIVEQNAVLGNVNKKFSNDARFVFTAFDDVIGAEHIDPAKIFKFAMIARPEFYNKAIQSKDSRGFNILITGGSQGAKEFSTCVPKALSMLDKLLINKCNITFQVHKTQVSSTRKALSNLQCRSCDVQSFFYDMDAKMLAADLIIARAGAATIAEICAGQKPSILVPYKYAKDNHQYHNAKRLADEGAAHLLGVEDDGLTKFLAANLQSLLGNTQSLDELGAKAAKFTDKSNIDQIVQKLLG